MSYIKKRGWHLVDIYADEGKSGTATKHRDDFNRMIADAEAGRLDVIVTKNVSRFARNLINGIETARRLLALPKPVEIFFEEENLSTFRQDSEFILSVMLIMAQGESEKKSKAITSAFKWRCEEGKFMTPVNNLLAYYKNENGELQIEPEGVKTVRAIYAAFLNGVPASEIARMLTAAEKATGKDSRKTGIVNKTCGVGSVFGIIKNERYSGTVLTQKTLTPNVFDHRSVKNYGQEPQHIQNGHHVSIVSLDEHVRALMLASSKATSKYYNPYYSVQIIPSGLLTGFIPMNVVFGGYDAVHYLGAANTSGVNQMRYAEAYADDEDDLLIVRSQDMGNDNAAQLTISSTHIECKCQNRINHHYVEILLNPLDKRLAIRPTGKDNHNALPWPINKVYAKQLCKVIYELMGWVKIWKYRLTGEYYSQGQDCALVFDLTDPEYMIYKEEMHSTADIAKQINKRELNSSDIKKQLEERTNKNTIAKLKTIYRAHVKEQYIVERTYEGTFQNERWRNRLGVEPQRNYNSNLEINTQPQPIDFYPENPTIMTKTELVDYLNEMGVQYA
ncbi:hypothetical protein AGMMS49992_31150 [Clostridia bacterium]|nr:hypothetical protein AGMMS49992_31150 [Clostridia bacterium]